MRQFKCTTCNAVETLRMKPDCCSFCRGFMAELDSEGDDSTNPPFDFVGTPEQAWLLVTKTALDAVNITPNDLSHGTLRSRADIYALREDDDATDFMDRWQKRYGIINIRENALSPKILSDWESLSGFQQAEAS